MATAINQAVAVAKPSQFEAELAQYEPQIRAALPSHIPVERFKRTFITAINQNPDLARLDRRSLFTSLVKCAQDGLMPDGREAALVAFKDKATYLPMVAGVIKRMRNSAELASITAHVVYERDEFEYVLGDDERISHKPAIGERGKPIGAYAIAKLKSGETQREFMAIDQIEAVRRVSRAAQNGPWVAWWDQMARKSVIKRLAKFLPMSADDREFLRRDDEIETTGGERPQTRLAAVLADPTPEPEPTGEIIDDKPVPRSDSPTEKDTANGAAGADNASAEPGQDGGSRPVGAGVSPPQAQARGAAEQATSRKPVPHIAVPAADASVKVWGNYRGQLVETIKTAPDAAWLAEFQERNQDGLTVLEADFPPAAKMVREAIQAALAGFGSEG